MIKVPDNCLVCGAEWVGGCQLPGKPIAENARVFYRCGASMSAKILTEGVYRILLKNCQGVNPCHSI